MNNNSLHEFAERVLEAGAVSLADVNFLRRDILADGLMTREDADILIALDRTVSHLDAAWADWFIATLTEFAVWTSTPTGQVDAEAARWLITSIACGEGPTDNAARLACEIVREAERADEALLIFALRGEKRRRAPLVQAA